MWTPYYAAQVVSKLYELRERGAALREELKHLDPATADARAIPDRADMYEAEIQGFWVLYQVRQGTSVIIILNIDEVV